MHQLQLRIPDNSGDVRMPADEEIWFSPHQLLLGAWIVTAGMASDMCHVDAEPIAFPLEFEWQLSANFFPIDVAENAT